MIEKSVKAPLTYNPSKGRQKEHLAYLNKGEMKALRLLNGNNIERGPSGLPSFPPADAAGSSSKASSTKSSSSVSRISGGTAGSNAARAAATKTTTRAPAASAAAAKASASKASTASSAAKTALSGGGGARDSGQAANRPSSGSSVSRISGGVPGSNKGRADFLSYSNKENAYYANRGKNAGMAFTPMVMRDSGSYLVGGGPGAPPRLISPGYETYYTDRMGNVAPVGNVMSNYLKDNPVAMTGIRTLSGAGPVDYYRAAHSVQFRPIPYSELNKNVYGYMDPQYSSDSMGMIDRWNPKVVVDPTKDKSKDYKLGGYSRPIMSNTGLGYGSPMERGHFQTLAHELQHVGQHSLTLSPSESIFGDGETLSLEAANKARQAYDPSPISMSNYQGFETTNRELDLMDARARQNKDMGYSLASEYVSNNYLSGVPGYRQSAASGLSALAAPQMAAEAKRFNSAGLNPEADRFTLQTARLQGTNNPRYGQSTTPEYVSIDYGIRQAIEEDKQRKLESAISGFRSRNNLSGLRGKTPSFPIGGTKSGGPK